MGNPSPEAQDLRAGKETRLAGLISRTCLETEVLISPPEADPPSAGILAISSAIYLVAAAVRRARPVAATFPLTSRFHLRMRRLVRPPPSRLQKFSPAPPATARVRNRR